MATLQLSFQRDPATGQIQFSATGYPIFETNAGANTYGQMQARIANEVLGSPTTSDIQAAIQDAISEYERESFWFNNMRLFGDVTGSLGTIQTTQAKEFYSSSDLPVLGNYPHISKVLVLAYNNRYPLNERTTSWIDDQSVSPSWNGMPTDWCWQAGALRLYPIPQATYPLIIDGTTRFAPLAADADYSCWTNEAEALIRFEAKRLLFINIIRDPDQASMMDREIQGAPPRQGILPMLRRETMRRTGGSGRIRPSRGYF